MYLALTLYACTAPSSLDFDSAESPIVDGVTESAYPEVMFLYNAAVGSACTATLISPRVVLTAKHCVQDGDSESTSDPSDFRLFVGENSRRPTAQYLVSEVIPAPGRWDIRDASDVALLILPAPAAEEPRLVNFGSPNALTTFTAIGYGQTPSGRSGTKMRVEKTVDGSGRGFIYVRPSVCSGDSGGPLIGPEGGIFGVASYIYSETGAQPVCGTAPGAYNGLQTFQEFIEGAIEDTGGCVASEEVCNGADDNCDGVVDEGCSAFGEMCTSDDQCASSVCGDTEAGVLCTQTCDPLRAELGCPPGFFCQNTGGCNGLCAPRTEELGHGAECETSGQCSSGYCAAVGEETRRCHSPCRDGQGMCLAGEVCFANADSCGACVEARFVAPPRDQGEPCEEDSDCVDGVCMDDAGVRFCARACEGSDECDEAFHCRASRCIPGALEDIGGGCLENGDCATGFCATQGEQRWCSAFCESIESCPLGFACTDLGEQSICTPANGLIGDECTDSGDCIGGLCISDPVRGSVCSRFCGQGLACSAGFECLRREDDGVCVRPALQDETDEQGTVPFIPSDSGCNASSSSSSGAFLWLIAILIALPLRLCSSWRRQ